MRDQLSAVWPYEGEDERRTVISHSFGNFGSALLSPSRRVTQYSLAPAAHPAYGSVQSLWAPGADRSPKKKKTSAHLMQFPFYFWFKPIISWPNLAESTVSVLSRVHWCQPTLHSPATAARPSEPNTLLDLWPHSSTAGGPHSAFPGSTNDTREGFFCHCSLMLRGHRDVWLLTPIISSRALSTFSLAWFIRLDICLLNTFRQIEFLCWAVFGWCGNTEDCLEKVTGESLRDVGTK